MSNFLAISTVTATLRRVLQGVIDIDVPGARVTSDRPEDPNSNSRVTGVNIYLYQISHNGHWRNADLPSRRSDGSVLQRPQVAIDLHYLFSFYGDEANLEPQRLLGSVVRALHSQPLISREFIKDTIAHPMFNYLASSDLADAVELVKFTPLSLSLEELSKLWSVFFQIPYTLSIAYQGTIVLIESTEIPQTALPVKDYNYYVIPFEQPFIEKMMSEEGERIPLDSSSTMIISGRNLKGDTTMVRIGGIDVIPKDEDISSQRIRLPLTNMPAGSLKAGIQAIQVIHRKDMGTPPTPHKGFESNVKGLILHPKIAPIKNQDITLNEMTVYIDPVIRPRQRVVLLLNELNLPSGRSPRVYAIESLSKSGTSGDLIEFSKLNNDPAYGELGLDQATNLWGVISDDLPNFAGITSDPGKIFVTIGDGGPHEVSIKDSPGNLDDARKALENAIQSVQGVNSFASTHVFRLDNRLLILCINGGGEMLISPFYNDPTHTKLGLDRRSQVRGIRSSDLSAFGGLTNDPAKVKLKIGEDIFHEVEIPGAPADLDNAAAALQTGIRAAHDSQPFTGAYVIIDNGHLLIIHGLKTIRFPLSGVTSQKDYLVRVQVDGSQSVLDPFTAGKYTGPVVTLL